MPYTYKGYHLESFPNPDYQDIRFTVNTNVLVDKIRITIAGQTESPYLAPLQCWSNLTNNYIGTVCNKLNFETVVAGIYLYQDNIEPQNGIEIIYPNKVQLTGSYQLRLETLLGGVPVGLNPNGEDDFYIFIEYFVKDD